VLENGLRLAELTGADRNVVQLFAVFHDSCRVNEGWDQGHGQRGADLAHQLRGQFFDLPDELFGLLYAACEGHTDRRTHENVTVQTCWDADRLDLPRVGMLVDPRYLCTAAAQDRQVMRWAKGRATRRFVPALVQSAWGLVLEREEAP
jgi:uncharacterized protein